MAYNHHIITSNSVNIEYCQQIRIPVFTITNSQYYDPDLFKPPNPTPVFSPFILELIQVNELQ